MIFYSRYRSYFASTVYLQSWGRMPTSLWSASSRCVCLESWGTWSWRCLYYVTRSLLDIWLIYLRSCSSPLPTSNSAIYFHWLCRLDLTRPVKYQETWTFFFPTLYECHHEGGGPLCSTSGVHDQRQPYFRTGSNDSLHQCSIVRFLACFAVKYPNSDACTSRYASRCWRKYPNGQEAVKWSLCHQHINVGTM